MSAPIGLGRLSAGRGLETVQTLSISSLQWVVGAFIATLGALMLVSPHQFAAPAYAPLSPHLAWFGPGLLLAGAGLLAVATPAPRFRYILLAHVWAGAMLLTLAGGFALSGSWSGTSNYGVLGLGTALAPVLGHIRKERAGLNRPSGPDRGPPQDRLVGGHTRGDAFTFLIGLATTLTGLLLLAMPAQFNASVYDPVRPYLLWYGLAFVAAGIILCLSQIGYAVPSRLGRWSSLLVAGPFFLFGSTVALPSRAWTGIAYYDGFGAALVVLG